jgi:SAM-dependent methyltransferase
MSTLQNSVARRPRHRVEHFVRRGIVEAARSTAGQVLFRSGYQETAHRVTLESLGLDHPDRGAYSASPWWVLRWLLPRSDVRSSDVFVEFGCGKGRVVLDAARRYPFRRVVGVELAPELSDVARRLVARERDRLRCRDVRIETSDATEYAIPDDMTHAYLYNPFNGPSFERFCANVVESLDRAPRPLRLIYVYPEDHEALAATGRFRLVRRVHTTRLVFPVRATIYEAN